MYKRQEYFPIPTHGNDVQITGKGLDGWCTDPDVKRDVCPSLPVIVDSVNNTWACLRTVDPPQEDSIYCNFFDATGYTIDFNRSRAGANFVEYYDIMRTPWQLNNQEFSLPFAKRRELQQKLEVLMACKGAADCSVSAPSLETTR